MAASLFGGETSLLRFQAGSEAGTETSLGLTSPAVGVLASMAGVTDSPNRAMGRTAPPLPFSKRALRWLRGRRAGSC